MEANATCSSKMMHHSPDSHPAGNGSPTRLCFCFGEVHFYVEASFHIHRVFFLLLLFVFLMWLLNECIILTGTRVQKEGTSFILDCSVLIGRLVDID